MYNNFMTLAKRTFKYLKKSFLPLSLASSLPAIILGYLSQPYTGITFLTIYTKTSSAGFSDILWMLLSKEHLLCVFPYIIVITLLILACSYNLSVIEKHFKTGNLVLVNPVRSINNSILSVIKVVPLILVVTFIILLIQAAFVSLIRYLITGPSGYTTILDGIWVIIISIILFLIQVTVSAFVGVWAVIMQIFGFSFIDAFVDAIRVVSKKWFSFLLGVIVPIFISLIPHLVLNALPFDLTLTKVLISMGMHLFIIIYYCAYIMVSVYSLTGLERRDEKSIVPKDIKYGS